MASSSKQKFNVFYSVLFAIFDSKANIIILSIPISSNPRFITCSGESMNKVIEVGVAEVHHGSAWLPQRCCIPDFSRCSPTSKHLQSSRAGEYDHVSPQRRVACVQEKRLLQREKMSQRLSYDVIFASSACRRDRTVPATFWGLGNPFPMFLASNRAPPSS